MDLPMKLTRHHFVEWVEPWAIPGSNKGLECVTVVKRMAAEDAIKIQKAIVKERSNQDYESDEAALEDFIVCHWAEFYTSSKEIP